MVRGNARLGSGEAMETALFKKLQHGLQQVSPTLNNACGINLVLEKLPFSLAGYGTKTKNDTISASRYFPFSPVLSVRKRE